jgi:hypothetical protein
VILILVFSLIIDCGGSLQQKPSHIECKWKQHNHNQTNLFRTLAASQDCFVEPSLVIQEKSSVPHNQGWSYCRYCRFHYRLTDQNYFSAPESAAGAELSWSQWSDFFQLRNDCHHTNHIPTPTFVSGHSLMISNPIFIVPLIEYHPGHLLVDFMEQVYSSMMELYGEVRMDALIVLDISAPPRRTILNELIDQQVNSFNDGSYGFMIRWLTNQTVISFGEFVSQMGNLSENEIIFSHIHFGGDISSTFMHLGTPHNPCQFQLKDSSLDSFSQNYQRFHNFISGRVNEMVRDAIDVQPIIDVLFIYRQSSRSIVNMKEMIEIVSAMNLKWLAVDFAVTPFKTQLMYLRKTRLLVAATGTAVHNMIFMNHSAAAIVVMMTDWCHCSWQYVNQGLLLGINVLTYCQPNDTENHCPISHWTANFWLQCSGVVKRSDMIVDLKRFASDVHQILNSPRGEKKLNQGVWCDIGRQSPFTTPLQSYPLPSLTNTNSTTIRLSSLTWKIRITGELLFPSIPQHVMKSFPHLSVCTILYLSDDLKLLSPSSNFLIPPSQCHSLDSLNYYSLLDIVIPSPTITIHSWIQLSSSGGRIAHSDNWLSLDLRVHESISRTLPEIPLRLTKRISDCLDSFSKNSLLVCPLEGMIDVPLCVGSISSESSFEISLQSIVRELCSLHLKKNISSCALLSALLSNCLHQRVLETQLSLPSPQYLPTPDRPFISLLLLEKSTRYSLRE